MVKAKRLKELRKQIERAERVRDPFEADRNHHRTTSSTLEDAGNDHDDRHLGGVWNWRGNNGEGGGGGDDDGPDAVGAKFVVEYRASAADLSEDLQQACLDMFEVNMGEHYRTSSFGLDLEAKRSELSHRKARYLLVFEKDSRSSKEAATNGEEGGLGRLSTNAASTTATDEKDERLAAYVHFRYCLDDDEAPTCAVLYVYEIQVAAARSGRGLGTRLMQLILNAANSSLELQKVMLTALTSNSRALRFYKDRLGFEVDATDPSTCGEAVDYEILSKKVGLTD